MGKRGPKPKPSALRVFEGDPGRLLPKREGEVAPETLPEIPLPPEWLGEHGQAKWNERGPQLHGINLLTTQDFDLFSLYCEAWDVFFKAKAEVDATGITLSTEKSVIRNPAEIVKRDAIARIKQIGACFGMTPTDRIGLKVETTKKSGLAAFKAR